MQTFHKWFCGDEDAILFAQKLFAAAQIWDDIADEGATEEHNALSEWLLYGKSLNPFYARFRGQLDPVLYCMYAQWRDATVLETASKEDCEKAFMLRAGIYTVWSFMAYLLGGETHAKECGPEIYRSYGEKLEDVLKEFNHA